MTLRIVLSGEDVFEEDLLKSPTLGRGKRALQDLFHVYLNKCEFQFLRLHINKTNTFCFLIDNGHVTGTTNKSK